MVMIVCEYTKHKKRQILLVVYPNFRHHLPVSGDLKFLFRLYKTSVDLRQFRGTFTPYRLDTHKILRTLDSKTLQDHRITIECFNKPMRINHINPRTSANPLEFHIALD